VIYLEQREFEILIGQAIASMEEAGYDPLAQFTGYLQSGDETYITRTGDARGIVRSLDKEQIAAYIEKRYKTLAGGSL